MRDGDGTLLRKLPGRNLSKADLCVYRLASGETIALKDFGTRPLLVRQTLGRMFVRRECRAYSAAAGAPGLVPFLGRRGPFALATAWVEAAPLSSFPEAEDAVFDRLDTILSGLHARGVAIADLHHRDVLVSPEGEVHVVDLAAAYVLGESPGPIRRSLFARFAAQDRLAAARMRARFTGRPEHEALAGVDPGAVRLWGIGRRIKGAWDVIRGRSR
ncbi:MAG TPA: hypothetical protein VFV19_11730 [Candidatus Polarisedimenticolaceae bacterium]|nr:hypothetical protein [Candidatus Polarisedimenticolaceae bacterium]